MANYSKAFNFRGGFQVDTDVLLVRGQNVGIGSTIPEERLDVDGTIYTRALRIEADEVRGDITTIDKANVGVLSVTEDLFVGVANSSGQTYFPQIRPAVRITTGIITSSDPATGVVTYYGDGAKLLNLPTSQWVDVDPGIGFTSIYAQGNVGIATTMPLYTFQVGGSPLARQFYNMNVGMNTGIGMENGNIFASGIVSTRGEFVGLGSLIVDLDARNLGIGTIPVERYGPLIVTDTVIASSFIGTATTAIGVRTDSFLDFDIGRANELEAVVRYISSEGKFQMGNLSYADPVTEAGDIDILKSAQTTVYALSEDSNSRIFVGKERNKGTQRRFGGFRFGGDPQDPDSKENDLDIVNYDIGNVNLYLHSGSGNVNSTIGEFRFIYGKTDRILATLNKNGRFRLNVNSNANEPSLDVVGFSTLRGDTYVGSDFYLAGDGKTLGDFEVGGRLILNDATLAGATFTQDVLVGNDPTAGVGDGVGISTLGIVTASRSLVVWGVGSPAVEATSSGDISLIGNLVSQQSVAANLVDATNIELDTAMVGPSNYSLDATGQAVDSSSVGTLKAVGGTISLRSPIEYYTLGITSTTITVDNINVGQSISGNFNITAANLNILNDINVSESIYTKNYYATGITSSSQLKGANSDIGIAQASSINVTGTTTSDTLVIEDGTVNGTIGINAADVTTMTINNVSNTPSFGNGMDVAGIINTDDVIAVNGTYDNLSAVNLDVTNVTSNPTFTGNITITGSLNINNMTATTLFATNATISNLSLTTIDGSFNTTGNIGVAGTITAPNISVDNLFATDATVGTAFLTLVDSSFDVSGNLGVAGTVTAAQISVTDLAAQNATIDTAFLTTVDSSFDVTGNVSVAGTITGGDLRTTSITVSDVDTNTLSVSRVTSDVVFERNVSVAGTITAPNVSISTITVTDATVNSLIVSTIDSTFNVNGNVGVSGTITGGDLQTNSITVSDVATNTIGVNSVRTNVRFLGDVGMDNSLDVGGNLDVTGTITANEIIVAEAQIGAITNSVEFQADINITNNLTVNAIGATSISVENLTADNAFISSVTNNPRFLNGFDSDGVINADEFNAGTAGISTATLGNVAITSVTNIPTFQNGAEFESLTTLSLANIGVLTATTIDVQNLDIGTITTPNLGFGTLSGNSINLSDTLTVVDIDHSGEASFNDVEITGEVTSSVTFTSTITAPSANLTNVSSTGTITGSTASFANLSVTNAVTDLDVTNLDAGIADINSLTNVTATSETLTVTDLVITGTLSGSYTQSSPPAFSDLTVTDLTATDLVTTDATVQNLDVTNITTTPNGVGLILSDTLTAAVGSISTITATELSVANLTVSTDATFNNVDISGGLTVSGNITFGTVEITDLTAPDASITRLQVSQIQGNTNFTSLNGNDPEVDIAGILTVEDLTSDIIRSGDIRGTAPGAFHYPAGDIRFHPGFTNGGNLFFYVAEGDGSNPKYATIELQNAPNEP